MSQQILPCTYQSLAVAYCCPSFSSLPRNVSTVKAPHLLRLLYCGPVLTNILHKQIVWDKLRVCRHIQKKCLSKCFNFKEEPVFLAPSCAMQLKAEMMAMFVNSGRISEFLFPHWVKRSRQRERKKKNLIFCPALHAHAPAEIIVTAVSYSAVLAYVQSYT